VLIDALMSRYLEVQRTALEHLSSLPSNQVVESDIGSILVQLALDAQAASDCRIAALELITSRDEIMVEGGRVDEVVEELLRQYETTECVPLREAILPMAAKLACSVRPPFVLARTCWHADEV
jgi:hypothetical protein